MIVSKDETAATAFGHCLFVSTVQCVGVCSTTEENRYGCLHSVSGWQPKGYLA
jgi:hypothetical protein